MSAAIVFAFFRCDFINVSVSANLTQIYSFSKMVDLHDQPHFSPILVAFSYAMELIRCEHCEYSDIA